MDYKLTLTAPNLVRKVSVHDKQIVHRLVMPYESRDSLERIEAKDLKKDDYLVEITFDQGIHYKIYQIEDIYAKIPGH